MGLNLSMPRFCWRCWGTGVSTVDVEMSQQMLRDEPAVWAELLVNGGRAYIREHQDCNKCVGTGLRKRYR